MPPLSFNKTVDFPQKYKDIYDKLAKAPSRRLEAKKAYGDLNKFFIDEACLATPIYLMHYSIGQQNWVHGTGAGVDGGRKQIRYWSPETIWIEKH